MNFPSQSPPAERRGDPQRPDSPSFRQAGPIPTPELARHLRAIEDSNHRAREWLADDRLEELVMLCDIVASHSTSAREAAWRRDQTLLGTHLQHARESLKLALKTFSLLPDRGRT